MSSLVIFSLDDLKFQVDVPLNTKLEYIFRETQVKTGLKEHFNEYCLPYFNQIFNPTPESMDIDVGTWTEAAKKSNIKL